MLVDLIWLFIEDAILEELDPDEVVNGGQALCLDDLEVLVHELDVGLVGDDGSVDIGQRLGAFGTSSGLLRE